MTYATSQRRKEMDHLRYLRNKKAFLDKAARWASENKEKKKASERKYDKANQKKKNARTANYRARKAKATPPWLTEAQVIEIRQFYENCPDGMEVDHIIPLNGKNVCGLHVPWNLQYLSAIENMKKGNRV